MFFPRPVIPYAYNSDSVQVTFKTATRTSTSTHPPSPQLQQWPAVLLLSGKPQNFHLMYQTRQQNARAIDLLEGLVKNPNKDETKWSWHQIKMMFEGEDRQALQTLLENKTITSEDQLIASHTLNVMHTSIKEEEHFWHFRE